MTLADLTTRLNTPSLFPHVERMRLACLAASAPSAPNQVGAMIKRVYATDLVSLFSDKIELPLGYLDVDYAPYALNYTVTITDAIDLTRVAVLEQLAQSGVTRQYLDPITVYTTDHTPQGRVAGSFATLLIACMSA